MNPDPIIASAKKFPAVPLVESLIFRCPKQMSVGIKTFAMTHKLDSSAVLRALIQDAADRHGINLRG